MGEVVEVDSKGRIVIPSSIRSKLGLEKGTSLQAEVRGDEIVLSKIVAEAEQVESEANSLKGFLLNPKQGVD